MCKLWLPLSMELQQVLYIRKQLRNNQSIAVDPLKHASFHFYLLTLHYFICLFVAYFQLQLIILPSMASSHFLPIISQIARIVEVLLSLWTMWWRTLKHSLPSSLHPIQLSTSHKIMALLISWTTPVST